MIRGAVVRSLEEARVAVAEAEQAAALCLRAAEAEAVGVVERAEAQAAAAVEAARLGAQAEGVAEAAMLVAQTAAALEAFWREREAELRDLALAVAHRVLSSVPRDEATLALACDALAEHARDARLELKASAETTDRLRAALAGLGFEDRVTVTADPSLGPADCVLVHARGRTGVGLLAQFRSLMKDGRP